jgi:hypothetical protein
MITERANKRPRNEDSDHENDSSDSDAFLGISDDDITQTMGKKISKLDPSNTDIVRYTALNKLGKAPKGSIGISAVRALLAKSGSVSKFAAASREANSGLRKAVRGSGARKTSFAKGKEKAAR